jgi:hypothetical protein
MTGGTASFDLRSVEYDVPAHRRSIRGSSLSDETKDRLLSFFATSGREGANPMGTSGVQD